jgi:hypothetical protein
LYSCLERTGQRVYRSLTTVLLGVIDDWGIASKIGYFMMDNASNNDAIMRSLARGKYYTGFYFFFL